MHSGLGDGDGMDYDPTGFLPTPNLWERLTDAGVRTVIVHPSSFFQDFPPRL